MENGVEDEPYEGEQTDEEATDWSAVAERRYESLSDAFRHRGTDLDNRAFLERLLQGVDVEGLYARGDYIMVARLSGEPALQIHFGYTNGFRSEDEVVSLLGDVERWPSRRRRDTWGVTHPVHGNQQGSSSKSRPVRSQIPCPTCGDLMPLTNVCDFCG